jgi:hypothetical protein
VVCSRKVSPRREPRRARRRTSGPELSRAAARPFVDIGLGLMAKPPYYTKESADNILFRMQVRATQSILTATTALTMIAVEKAINAILAAVKVAVNQAVKFALV